MVDYINSLQNFFERAHSQFADPATGIAKVYFVIVAKTRSESRFFDQRKVDGVADEEDCLSGQ